jgi:G:T-mismatch repair DNA endonuclease (very short patch repair protein)
MHSCKYGRVRPKQNEAFWENKRQANVRRDKVKREELKRLGYHVETIWECQTKHSMALARQIEHITKKMKAKALDVSAGEKIPH